jgi:hypothetical protein
MTEEVDRRSYLKGGRWRLAVWQHRSFAQPRSQHHRHGQDNRYGGSIAMKSQHRLAARTILALALTALSSTGAAGASPPNLTGRAIVAIADGDMLAAAYYDQQLPPPHARVADTLSITRLPLSRATTPTAVIEASNSVTAAPFPAAVSPDGRFAFVVETLGPAAAPSTQLADLPPGRRLFSIDLAAIDRPAVRHHIDLPSRPMTVHVHPTGDLLAVTTASPGQEMVLVPVDNGHLGHPVPLSLAALGVMPDAALPSNGMAVGYAEWHPSGRYLAVTLHMRDEVAFFALTRNSALGTVSLSPWGNRVKIGGRDPYAGHFTPDGRFFITSDWGRNLRIGKTNAIFATVRGNVSLSFFLAPVPYFACILYICTV